MLEALASCIFTNLIAIIIIMCSVVWVILHLAVLIEVELRLVTDGRTTPGHRICRAIIASRGKKWSTCSRGCHQCSYCWLYTDGFRDATALPL